MNITHFNRLRLNLCQESQKPRILSCDFSQPDQSGSDTDRQINRRSTYRRSKPRRGVDLEKTISGDGGKGRERLVCHN